MCQADDSKVVDSRLAEEGSAVRRRRECLSCQARFTTFERVEDVPLAVVKSDGRQVPFERAKVAAGVAAATKGRDLRGHSVGDVAERVEERIRGAGPVVTSSQIGLAVLDQLRSIDEVAYLRFASVYKHFDAASDFHREIELLTKERDGEPSAGDGPDPASEEERARSGQLNEVVVPHDRVGPGDDARAVAPGQSG